MDTKLNQLTNNKAAWLLRAVAVICIFLLSLGVVAGGYPKFYQHSKSWYDDYDSKKTTASIEQFENEQVLFCNLLAKNYTFGSQSQLVSASLFSNFNQYFANEVVAAYDLRYVAIDTKNNQVLEKWDSNYYLPMEGNLDSYREYDLKLTFSYDKKGKLSLSAFDGFRSLSRQKANELIQSTDVVRLLYDYGYEYADEYSEYGEELLSFKAYVEELEENISLKDLEITYLIPLGAFYGNHDNLYYQLKGGWALEQSGIFLLFIGFFLLSFLLGCFFPMKPFRFPAELSAGGCSLALGVLLSPGEFVYFLYEMLSGNATVSIIENLHLALASADSVTLCLYGCNVLLWFLVGMVTFLLGHSLRLLFVLKPKEWFFTCTFTGRCLAYANELLGRLQRWLFSLLQSVDFSDSLDKKLLKLVSIQFLITGLLSLAWFFGTFGILAYSVFLFFFLKKYALELKQKYQVLLSAADEMAGGNLNISIEEDLGPFSSLGTAFTQIQQGFKKAVEEETKSQQMKTELITNVSHDLKTPLTAIITYVNLLKEEKLTDEERSSYVDTLDKKSLRLKQLIEDLFEVSKANSSNISLHPVEVDLNALLKQVALELEDQIAASKVDFRYQLPEEKVLLTLDSEKTYRIIENLMGNITKYALPGSRAYIALAKEGEKTILTMKNVSAEELTFSTEEITERFVRGDKSRSTEGAGLGLAIAKSFTELQGGSLQITTDGDLFKATVAF